MRTLCPTFTHFVERDPKQTLSPPDKPTLCRATPLPHPSPARHPTSIRPFYQSFGIRGAKGRQSASITKMAAVMYHMGLGRPGTIEAFNFPGCWGESSLGNHPVHPPNHQLQATSQREADGFLRAKRAPASRAAIGTRKPFGLCLFLIFSPTAKSFGVSAPDRLQGGPGRP